MHYSTLLPFLAPTSLITAAPTSKRGDIAMYFNPPPGGDVTILNYALTLEYLERKFYMEGLAKFSPADFVNAGFKDRFIVT
jgi:hypothetical protein